MNIIKIHPCFKLPELVTAGAGAYDIFMPEAGEVIPLVPTKIPLGFAAEVPQNFVALLLPRSSCGSKGISLANTVGVIDSDYRGEWIANVFSKHSMRWEAGDRFFQFMLVPVLTEKLVLVDHLNTTMRATGGFGSTGK